MQKYAQTIKQNLNLPNLLSLFRIVLIVPFVHFFLMDEYALAGGMLLLSGLSDLCDGYLARTLNQTTKLGAMLDPVADKLTLAAVIICIGIKFTVAGPIVFILVFKEVCMLVAGVFLLNHNETPAPAKWYGKLATTVFYISVILLVSLKAIWNFEDPTVTVVLMSISAFFMLFALVRYFFLFVEQLKNIRVENGDNTRRDVKDS